MSNGAGNHYVSAFSRRRSTRKARYELNHHRIRQLLTLSSPEIATATLTGPEAEPALLLIQSRRVEGLSHASARYGTRGLGGAIRDETTDASPDKPPVTTAPRWC